MDLADSGDSDDSLFETKWAKGGKGAKPAADAAVPVVKRRPCILYLDSLGGSKEHALDLLKTFLAEEWKDQVRIFSSLYSLPLISLPTSLCYLPLSSPSLTSLPHLPPSSPSLISLTHLISPSLPQVRRGRPAGPAGAPGSSVEPDFDRVVSKNVRVNRQRNNKDCGLYMLMVIECSRATVPG